MKTNYRRYTWNVYSSKGTLLSQCEMVARNSGSIRRMIASQARNGCFGPGAIFGRIKSTHSDRASL